MHPCYEKHKIILRTKDLELKYNISSPAILFTLYQHFKKNLMQMDLKKLNGILGMKSIPLPALNPVVLTRPGAVRPEWNHPFPALCPVVS